RPLHEGLVVVLTTPRSASNNLTRLLAQHPEILMVEEIFNRDLQIVAGKATVLKRPGVPLHDVPLFTLMGPVGFQGHGTRGGPSVGAEQAREGRLSRADRRRR